MRHSCLPISKLCAHLSAGIHCMKIRRSSGVMVAVLSTALLVGCAAMRDPFPEASGSDAATLVINRTGSHNMQVYGFKDSSNCTTPMNFGGTQLMTPGEERTVRLEIGKEAAISFHTYIGHGTCDLVVSFVPQARMSYRATLDSTDKQCFVRLVRKEELREVLEPTFRKRTFTRPLTESGSFCRG